MRQNAGARRTSLANDTRDYGNKFSIILIPIGIDKFIQSSEEFERKYFAVGKK